MTIRYSLFMKLAMLVATMGLVFWIGWQAPEAFTKHEPSAEDSRSVPVRVSIAAETDPPRPDRFTTGPTAAKSGASQELSLGSRSALRGLLDINRAEAKDFESLPGIGAVLAQRVIAYRREVGGFQAIEDLRAVKGIGSKTFERIRPLVTVVATDMKGKVENRPL